MEQMINLDKFPLLRWLTNNFPDIRWACSIVIDLYQARRRVSGRLVIEHCFETAENTGLFTFNPAYLTAAVFHDVIEDFGLNPKELKFILGPGREYIASLVNVLSKRPDLKGSERTAEYLNRISKATRDQDLGVGIVKLSDRLSNLTDLEYLPQPKRKCIAKETLEFYVPFALSIGLIGLAHRLTIMSRPYL